MAPSCEHSDSLSDIHSVEYGGVDVESSTCDLSFRPGTKLSLVLTKKPQREAPRVKIAIEGSTENLRGKIWYPSEKDGEIDTTRWNVELNTEYRVPLALKHRVFCKVWTEECPLCKADAEQKAVHETQLQSLRSQLKQLENRLAEQRLQSENTQKVMESRIRQLEQAAVDNERKLKTVVDQNESLKKETEESAAKISELTAALAEETKARESVVATNVAAATLENELLRLDARIDSLKKRLAKQREGAENTQKQLRFRIRAMEEKAVAKKRNYGSILSALESKCGRLQEEAKIAAKSQAELEKEIKELKSALADEQTRFSALQQEHRAEIEAEREKRAGESAAVIEKLAAVLKEKEFLMEEIGCMRSQVFNFKHEEEAERQNADDPQANAVSPSAVPAEFSAMRDAAFLTDFCLVLKRKEIAVHRNVLALKSTLFESLFRANPQATKLDVDKKFSSHVMHRLVDFCYHGKLSELAGDAHEMYAAARYYEVPDLLAACVKSLKASISTEKAADLLVLAVAHDDRELGAFAVDFAKDNGGKLRLLGAAPIQALGNEREMSNKILEWVKHERVDGGQPVASLPHLPPPRPPVDSAEGHFDSSSSSSWEPVDAK